MKKTLTVNLGGTVFQIDEDAYILLDNYLNNLRFHFRHEKEGDEIVSDMEMRISELFIEFMEGGQQVITIDNVEAVIARMGKPEEFDDEEDRSCSNENRQQTGREQNTGRERDNSDRFSTDGTREQERNQENTWNASCTDNNGSKVEKRLYRDIDHRVLGGVLAGIAAYCGWDVTALRLLVIILGLLPHGFGFPMLIVYFILQFIVPPARTATEKLRMRGEPVNMENIGKTVTGGFDRDKKASNEQVKSGFHKFLEVVVQIFAIIVKVFIGFLLICCIPVLFGLLIALLAVVMSAFGIIIHFPSFLSDVIPRLPCHTFACPSFLGPFFLVCALMVVGIPLVGIVYAILQQSTYCKPMNSSTKIILLVIWLLALLAGCITLFGVL